MLTKTATEIVYQIDIDIEWMNKIITYEIGSEEDRLYDILDRIDGCSEVDYSGHFGAHIWITIDPKKENDKLWAKIEKTIRGYVGLINLTSCGVESLKGLDKELKGVL